MRPMSWLRYYADVCCPEDREYYRIVNDGEQLHDSAHLTPPPQGRLKVISSRARCHASQCEHSPDVVAQFLLTRVN
jgi:hypothetical protein